MNQLRLIGGRHRGRKLTFPNVEGLRPTPDRVRETLFNWLGSVMPGSRCLDLFAGSGALGLEAYSRGAREVVMVDQHSAVVYQLHQNVKLLDAQGVEVVQMDGLVYLNQFATPFDVIFLDPPYQADLLPACIEKISSANWLSPDAWIYLEAEKQQTLPAFPENWQMHRSKQAGQVGYHLIHQQR